MNRYHNQHNDGICQFLPSSLINDMSLASENEPPENPKTYHFYDVPDNDNEEANIFCEEEEIHKQFLNPRTKYNSSTNIVDNRSSDAAQLFYLQRDMTQGITGNTFGNITNTFIPSSYYSMSMSMPISYQYNINLPVMSSPIIDPLSNFLYPSFIPPQPQPHGLSCNDNNWDFSVRANSGPSSMKGKGKKERGRNSTKQTSCSLNSSFGTDSVNNSNRTTVNHLPVANDIESAFSDMNIKLSIAKRKNYSSENVKKFKIKTEEPGKSSKKKSSLFLGKSGEKKKGECEEDFQRFIANLNCEIHEYICSQKGSRVMQKHLHTMVPEDVCFLIRSLGSAISSVMMDIYGNYFCQKLIMISSSEQRLLILKHISSEIVKIASDSSGTHVLQVILDIINLNEEERVILNAINGKELEMSYDSNATHVIQKILICIEESKREHLNTVIISNIKILCLHCNGICVVKKLISSNKSEEIRCKILEEILINCLEIAQSPYGNYAIQYIFEEWGINNCRNIFNIIIQNIVSLSMQKYSSNVIEKLLELSNNSNSDIFPELFNSKKILGLLKNKYGKYVLQKAVKHICQEKKEEIKNILSQITITSEKEKSRLNLFLELL